MTPHREYCASGRQHTQVCLLLVELSVDLKEWSSARDSITRAEHTVMGDIDDPLFHHKLRALQGLVYLAEGRYFDAAKSFTSVSPDLTNQVNSVISAEDMAMYGSLLGLATMDRETLLSLVIDGAFKGRLELVPDMREALRHYSRAEYGQCLSILQHTLQRDLLIDIHLHSHVPILLDMIRDKCIEQYFQPYSSASLEKMGNVFGCTLDEMEMIVVKLIANGSLGEGARVNAADYTLCVESGDNLEKKTRRRARVAAGKMGAHFTRNAEGMIMRKSKSCHQAVFCIHFLNFSSPPHPQQVLPALKVESRSNVRSNAEAAELVVVEFKCLMMILKWSRRGLVKTLTSTTKC
jgi:hypothetical protein